LNSEVYTVADIQGILKISKNVAYDLIKQEGFPVIKIKSTYRVPVRAFEKWLDKVNQIS
jgi:hypothetical protein